MTEQKPVSKSAGSPKKPSRGAAKKRASAYGSASEAVRFYYKGNRHKQLRAFVATVKLGTLSRAAEALYLSQPSVSLQLQALERELGTTLLERRRRRINLTDAGEALYELARPLVEGWENLDRDFQAKVQGLQAGKLVIAAGTSTIQYLLPELVRRYRERHPAVQLQLANVTGKDGLAMLRDPRHPARPRAGAGPPLRPGLRPPARPPSGRDGAAGAAPSLGPAPTPGPA